MRAVERLLRCENRLGEGPVWDFRSAQLYWLDIEGRQLWHWRVGAGDPSTLELRNEIGCLGLMPEGDRLIAATSRGFAFLNIGSGELKQIFIPPEKDPDVRFNDGAVGPDGGFWAGTLSDDPVNNLYRLTSAMESEVRVQGVRISNGIGWSPDRHHMYYTDSLAGQIDIFDFDPDTGMVANRRVFVDSQEKPGVPDGLTVDSEGCVWSARWDGWKITRYDPEGTMMDEIPVPAQRPTSCTFGGEDLKDLFITSAWTGLDRNDARHADAGSLFRLHTDIRGIPEYLFGN